MSSANSNTIESSMLSESPSEPMPAARRRRTRRRVFGGFILTDEEAFKWANQLRVEQGKRVLKLSRWDEANCLVTLDERVKEDGGIQVNFYGQHRPETEGGGYDRFIVITQIGVGVFEYENGEPAMDPQQKLVPGPFEERAKELLKLEGVQHSEYDTIFA